MPTLRVTGRRIFAHLPARAQDAARAVLERRAAKRAVEELAPDLALVDAAIGGFGGKRVVEIGSDHAAATLRAVARLYTPAELVGVNPAFASRQLAANVRTEQTSAQRSGLPDASIDAVFSSSAFEHIHDLGDVLEEMHRVLVPGGLLYSHFGPIWSSSYGHHLWIEHEGRLLTYHNVLLPPWCHLLSDRDTVRDLLTPEHGDALADRMTDFVFASPEQNQLLFDDYERVVAASPFETVFLKGYDAPDLAASYPSARSPAILDELAGRFPGRRGFLYDGITLLLRKQESPQ
ncbi:MAG TPA: class I SAM-dependent methyltransferase [Actinomycetes bacterium]|jgi:SAM-dependent methyltransferase